MGQQFTSRLIKGGAVLGDTRRVVERWDAELDPRANLESLAAENPLGKTSRSRLDDLLCYVIRPRYVAPGAHVIPTLKSMTADHRAFREACYYEACRADDLLAAFAEMMLWDEWQHGRLAIGVADVLEWLTSLERSKLTPKWSESVRTRVAQGLLSTTRDFGILNSPLMGRRKEFAAPALTPRGFVYTAWREHEQGASSWKLVTGGVWQRWLLDAQAVDDLFTRSARLGVLRFSRVGSSVRVDWLVDGLEEAVRAAA